MARSSEKKARAGDDRRQKLWRELALVVLAPLLFYLLASLFTYSSVDPGWSRTGSVAGSLHNIGGLVGAYMADLAFWLFGFAAYTVPLVLGGIAWIALFGLDSDGDGRVDFGPALRLIGIVGFLVSICGLLQLLGGPAHDLPAESGGILGQAAGNSMRGVFGDMGGRLFLFVVFMLSVTLATGMSWFALMDWIGGLVLASITRISEKKQEAAEWQRTRNLREEREEVRKADSERRAKREPVRIEAPSKTVIEKSERAQREQQIPLFNVGGDTALPPLSLLDDPKPQPKGYSEETLETLSRQIEFKLKDFRIEAQVVGAYPGPVITRFELEPAPGVKGSQISSLDKDIARGLSVKSVRVVDVIPGKSVVGLEIPNTHREMIYLSELLRSKEYDKSPSPLTIALGKDIGGRPVVADLTRMPHLLVAGTTGSGKSV
ncbi:MAG: DNA translocase FtsK 4TM domain-containing protein, partial [Arenimonas sp.]